MTDHYTPEDVAQPLSPVGSVAGGEPGRLVGRILVILSLWWRVHRLPAHRPFGARGPVVVVGWNR